MPLPMRPPQLHHSGPFASSSIQAPLGSDYGLGVAATLTAQEAEAPCDLGDWDLSGPWGFSDSGGTRGCWPGQRQLGEGEPQWWAGRVHSRVASCSHSG